MAISNHERVRMGLAAFADAYMPWIVEQFKRSFGPNWHRKVDTEFHGGVSVDAQGVPDKWNDAQILIKAMEIFWGSVFKEAFGSNQRQARSYISELHTYRNMWAHEPSFPRSDVVRCLDTIERMLQLINEKEFADQVSKIRELTLREQFQDKARGQTRYAKASNVEGATAGLKPWREVIQPHRDVASGKYQMSEFAANLQDVVMGRAMEEYQDPKAFFSRTYITRGLGDTLRDAIKRIAKNEGNPVVQLQTNFGGGKTHSMMALFHLFSPDTSIKELPGIEPILEELQVTELPAIHKAVLVGTALDPQSPLRITEDNTQIRTLWGEMAWQLGDTVGKGAEAYAIVAENDQSGVAPGSEVLIKLFNQYTPALVLIDEWVAYIRQTYEKENLRGGTFDNNITFVQSLTEAAKSTKNTLIVASLPQSEKDEAGGDGGVKALNLLSNTFKRLQNSWRPADAQESFEIIRKRLFEPIDTQDAPAKDAVVNAFFALYEKNKTQFPTGCGERDYKRSLDVCYPIHPEVFNRLYKDWSTLDKFQQTRGVLKLMAKVITSLWQSDDKNILILPSTIPFNDPSVRDEFTDYLENAWKGVIDKDIDGPDSLPDQIDNDTPSLGKYHACKRVARSVFLATAPHSTVGAKDTDDKCVALACVYPNEQVHVYGDALRRLSDKATYLYQDGNLYWYSTHPTLNRLIQDKADALSDPSERLTITSEIINLLRDHELDNRKKADFRRLHPYTNSGDRIEDLPEIRAVFLGPDFVHTKSDMGSHAIKAASTILAPPRQYQNCLVFVAPDADKLKALEESVCYLIACREVLKDKQEELTPAARTNAEKKARDAEQTALSRIQEVWTWAFIPEQNGGNQIKWEERRLAVKSGFQESIATRLSKKLKEEDLLIAEYGLPILAKHLQDNNIWGSRKQIQIKDIWEMYSRYLQFPRLISQQVLLDAINQQLVQLFFEHFGHARGYDENTEKYDGLKINGGAGMFAHPDDWLIEIQTTMQIHEAQSTPKSSAAATTSAPVTVSPKRNGNGKITDLPPEPEAPVGFKYFTGAVELEPERIIKRLGDIDAQIIQKLTDIKGSKVKITLEIEAESPDAFDDDAVRSILEDCQTLKFFKKELY